MRGGPFPRIGERGLSSAARRLAPLYKHEPIDGHAMVSPVASAGWRCIRDWAGTGIDRWMRLIYEVVNGLVPYHQAERRGGSLRGQ